MKQMFEIIESNYGSEYVGIFKKFNGHNITGELEESGSEKSDFVVSIRYMIADYFLKTSKEIKDDFVTMFKDDDDKKVYLLTGDMMYEFCIEKNKSNGYAKAYDLKQAINYNINYRYKNTKENNKYGFNKPIVERLDIDIPSNSIQLNRTSSTDKDFDTFVKRTLEIIV